MKEDFRIRTYGRTELALVYFPKASPECAWRSFKRWLIIYPGLARKLGMEEQRAPPRFFTPRQVEEIVEALGAP